MNQVSPGSESVRISLLFLVCVIYRRVNTELALKCQDADLLILEGMGRYCKMMTSCSFAGNFR